MLEVSWGELGVVIGIGLFLIGRRDLPNAARIAGTQVGRVVGLLQGARARADRFAAQSELTHLQNELRSGLRELDAVKSELAVSMSTRGMIGRQLGATVPGVNRSTQASTPTAPAATTSMVTHGHLPTVPDPSTISESPHTSERSLPPSQQTIAAVAEEEWEKQGISFRSRAEQGSGMMNAFDQSTSGSAILASLMQQTLVFDQYDRVVKEQDEALESKVQRIQEKNRESKEKASVPTKD